MRLLVTGGAGFIGSNFIRWWLARHRDDRVTCYDLETYAGDRANLADVERASPDRYRFIHGDITDTRTVDAAIEEAHPDAIVNFAAESHNSRAVLDPGVFVRTNTLGTQVLLEACRRRRVPRFHHISTCEVYGDLALDSPERFTEESAYRPRTPYNASKAAADLVVRAYSETYGLPATISNCSNNYGPYQHPEKLIPLFATNAIDGRPLPLYRSSANRREWLHVDDHCAGIEAVLLRGRIGETYNIGSGIEFSIDDVADAILGLLRQPASLKKRVDDRPGHDRRYLLDHSKIQRELGWEPRIPWETGLRSAVEWYRTNEQWWRPRKQLSLDEFNWARAGAART